MAKIICFANHKGGVGKTTTTANIGAIMAQKGKRTLIIDLDTQANLTTYYLPDTPDSTIYNSITEKKNLTIIPIKENLDLVASSIQMANIEPIIANDPDRNYILSDLLEPLKKDYDYILLDCPPALNIVTVNALIAATDLYIVTTAEVLPTKGLKNLLDMVNVIQKRQNQTLKLSGIIINRWEVSNLSKNVEEGLREKYKDIVLSTKIRKNVSLAEAAFIYQDILTYSPQSNGAIDYLAAAEEILNR